MRILHVEDSPVDADLVALALGRTAPEAQLELATSIAQARELLQRPERYDLALIDLRLPDGDGLDLLGEIREQGLALPVVMLTGSGDQRAAIAALQSGADDYVAKEVESYAGLAATISAARERFAERSRRRSGKLRVLYAEHDPADIDLTRRHLARYAPFIRLTVVPDAVVALSHLPPERHDPCDFDVLLLDYRLPGIDALDAVRSLRIERGLDLPIVIVSGQGSEQVAARAIHLGVDDYIVKHPGYLYELAPTLEKVHRQHELIREQRALQQTSRHLSFMLEASPVVLYTMIKRGGALVPNWVSANISRLFGYSADEALVQGWWLEHVHPDDREAARQALRRLSDAQDLVHEYRFLDRGGAVHWIRDEIRMLPDALGEIGEVLGAWHDITGPKLADQIQQTRIAALDTLMEGKPLASALGQIATRLEAILPQMRVSILLRDAARDELHTIAAPSLPEFFRTAVDGLKPATGHGSCGTAAATGETVSVDDVQTHPYWAPYRELAARAGIRACWSVPFKDEDGTVLGTFAIYHDRPTRPAEGEIHLVEEFSRIAGLAVQRGRIEADLRQAAAVLDSTTEGVIVTDLVPRIVAVNRAYTEITGYSGEEAIGRNPSLLKSGRQDCAFYQAMWSSLLTQGHWRGEIWNRRRDGSVFPQLLTISTVRDPDGQPSNYVAVMTDITQIKESEANLERLAHYDPLTGLPNRLLTQSRVEHALEQAKRTRRGMAVLFLDIDRFKNVNDSLGHPAGDRLLRAIGERLRQRLRGEDTLGRLGGDEFLILLDHCERPEDAGNVARDLIGVLEAPFVLPDRDEVYIGASIGISLYPQDGQDTNSLIRHADAAMYQAKEQGRNTFRFYTPELTLAVNQRLELEARLRRALGSGEFVIHYQPQIDSVSGGVIGAEALLRWNDPERGMIPPADFVPLAEETGLIIPLGDWVMQTACAQFRQWLDLGLPPFCLSVNLSARQLQQPDIVQLIAGAIEQHALPAERLKLELTESMIMGHGEQAAALLGRIKALGVRLSIDDFGTGYSSLAYLKRFPIDELKIDRGFVRDIPSDSSDAEIAATIIAMARNLRLQVVAEGVETEAQAAFLAGQGCQAYQGYLFSRPLPAAEFERFVLDRA
jgi:diguanylate cyclase (GGDEF)-like protein/PAS domain S-box-containing protein